MKTRRNYFLPFFLAAFIFTVLMCSCTTKKNLHKSSETVKEHTETATSYTKTEQADTSLTTKPDSLEAEKPLSEVLAGDTISSETAEMQIQTWYDPVKKTIKSKAKAKSQVIPFKFTRTTVGQAKTVTDKKTVTVVKDKEVKKETSWFSWWWLLIAIPIFLAWRLLYVKFLRPYLKGREKI